MSRLIELTHPVKPFALTKGYLLHVMRGDRGLAGSSFGPAGGLLISKVLEIRLTPLKKRL